MRLRISNFQGETPKTHRTLLPEGFAQQSLDADHGGGVIDPMRVNVVAHDASPAAPVDFYLHKGVTWLTFDADVDVVPGPVSDDRLYISREGSAPLLKVMPAGTEYPLALPIPPAPPTLSIESPAPTPGPDDPPPLVETVNFTYTWVSIFDEETLPAPPSAALNLEDGATVRVRLFDQPPVGSRINRVRIYRTQTSSLGITEYHFIKEVNAATPVYVHDVEVDPLQEIISSTFYDPPIAGLQGLTAMQSGMISGFEGKSLFFCEPYKPHAWPKQYELVTDYDIVALVSFGPILAILTTGTPYIAQGTAPENMVMERIEQNAPCLARDGVVDMGYAAAYPSTEGLVTISQQGAQIITRSMLSRKQWIDLKPETFSAGARNGQYVFTHGDPGERQAAMIDLASQSPSITRSSASATKFRTDIYTGALHFIDGSATIFEFSAESAARIPATWQSSEYLLPTLTGFGVLLIEGEAMDGDAPDIEATVYADGVLFATVNILNEPTRLPTGLARRWSIKTNGRSLVSRIAMAGSVMELFG